MALLSQTISNPNLNQANTKRYIVGGYDGHGSITATAVARALKIPIENLIVKFPDCSPELAPKMLYSLNLYGATIELFDIAINVKNPAEWAQLMNIVAQNNIVTMWDHHESNMKYLATIPPSIKLLQFNSATEMAKAIHENFEAEMDLLTIGIITDRDSSIKEIMDTGSMEFNQYYNLANIYDVLIRKDLNTTVRGVYQDGLEYIRRLANTVEYPPYQIVDQIRDTVKKIDNILYVEFTPAQNTSQWIWKVFDELLRRFNADYLVSVSKVLDRQINKLIDAVFVVRYWLSELQPPKALLQGIIGNRRVIGHDTAFSVSASNEDDAKRLAQEIINVLQSSYSVTASYIPSSQVARALQHDFRAIMQKQTEILQTLKDILDEQRKLYERYLELKDRQVKDLETLIRSGANTNQRALGAD